MDFSFSQQDEEFRSEFRKWLEANLPHEHRKTPFAIEFFANEEGEEWEKRLGWSSISPAIWRPRRQPHSAVHLRPGTGSSWRATTGQQPGHRPGRPYSDELGHRGAATTLSAKNALGQGDLVP